MCKLHAVKARAGADACGRSGCGVRSIRFALAGVAALSAALTVLPGPAAGASAYRETPYFVDAVTSGALPPVHERLPATPSVAQPTHAGWRLGRHGGDIRSPVRDGKDVKLMAVYGFARLVVPTPELDLVPDILEAVDVLEGRVFTFRLRKGHRWSDGHPFTAEDFRYWWEDVANNPEISPSGPSQAMRAHGELPVFSVIDEHTVRFAWSQPNPEFLHAVAAPAPLFTYRPAHYLKQFHARYADPEELKARQRKLRVRSWAALHERKDNLYLFNNPEQPTLQPWIIRSQPSSPRLIGERNPYYHRVDSEGRQLPYADRLILQVIAADLIPASVGTGDYDIAGRGLFMADYSFLKEQLDGKKHDVWLWKRGNGSHITLFPNLNCNDPVWRALFRDVRFRRALSLAIDRDEINELLFLGIAKPGNNTVLEDSPLFKPRYRDAWTEFDPEQAERLLDEAGLDRRGDDGIRLLPDGRPAVIIVQSAGERQEEIDALQLMAESYADVGLKLLIRPSHRGLLRMRATAGDTELAVWFGIENGLATRDNSPDELVPRSQIDFHWPKWGLYEETGGTSGEPADMDEVMRLLELSREWRHALTPEAREAIWHEMLSIHAEQVFTIGLIAEAGQPVVVSKRLNNVPPDGLYSWIPGGFFGIYRPDTFWFSE